MSVPFSFVELIGPFCSVWEAGESLRPLRSYHNHCCALPAPLCPSISPTGDVLPRRQTDPLAALRLCHSMLPCVFMESFTGWPIGPGHQPWLTTPSLCCCPTVCMWRSFPSFYFLLNALWWNISVYRAGLVLLRISGSRLRMASRSGLEKWVS